MNLLKSKKIIGIVSFIFSLVLLFFFFPRSIIGIIIPEQPVVIGGNFDLNQKKLPISTDHVDFIFSTDLDVKSINRDNIIISPDIKGTFSLINSNIIRFNTETDFVIGKHYLFSFSDKIKGSNGKNINSVTFELEIVSNAKVLKITPEGNLSNLNQNFAVFFSVPMVPLTDLDSRDKLPCPIKFEPEIEGKCSWTTTSVLEFIPKNRLYGSTNYKIKVENNDGLLYNLEKSEEIDVFTPKLDLYISNTFSPKEGINFNFNFPVNFEDLQNKLSLNEKNTTSINCDGYVSGKSKNIKECEGKNINKKYEFILTKNNDSNTSFNINLKQGSFDYNKSYYLNIKKGLKSKNGNIPINYEINKSLKSNGFLNTIKAYKDIYSSTGKLIDTKHFYTYGKLNKIPVKNIFFNLTFEEEVLLNKNFFDFKDDAGNQIDFLLNYVDDRKYNSETGKYENFLNKKKIKLSLKKGLKNNTSYGLVLKKEVNKYVKYDKTFMFYTSVELEVKDFTFINYSKSCLYLSNNIDNYRKIGDEIFVTEPETRKVRISNSDYIPKEIYNNSLNYGKDNSTNLNSEEAYSGEIKINSEKGNNYLKKQGYCRKANKGEYLYVLNTRLNPNSNYKLIVNNDFEDNYGNKLKNKTTYEGKTGNILDKDKYLYSSLSKDVNVIPNDLPIVINLQTINLEKVKLEVCEMDEKGFIDYDNNTWKKGFVPKCINKESGYVDVKNHNWNLTFNKFDLEEDFLKRKFKSNFILVIGSKVLETNNSNAFENINKFQNVYIRSNLSVAFEKGDNKELLFITDFKGNQKNDIDFNFYKGNLNKRGLGGDVKELNLNPTLNKKTNVFEFNNKESFDYVLVKDKNNPSNIGFLDLSTDYLSNYDFKYISGETTSQKKYLYLYTERPIYKPGDIVYFKGLLREFKSSGYVATDIKNASLELIGPSGKIIDSKKVIINENSNFSGSFVIPKEVDLGKFRFRFNIKNGKNISIVKNNAFFHIEEYRKPTFKVNIESEKKDFVLGDKLSLIIKPEYYFGGKIINTSGEYSVLSQNYFFDAKDYSDYNFGGGYRYFDCIYWGYCNYDDSLNKSGKIIIDNNGKFNFTFDFKRKKIKGEKIYNFVFDVIDPDTKRVVSKTTSKVLHNTDSYIGIKSKYYNSFNNGVKVDGVILDFDAKEKPFTKAKIELIKKEWKSVKKKGVDGVFYNNYSLDKKIESTSKIMSDKNGIFTKILRPKTSGEYEIKAIYTGNNGEEFISSKTIYVAGNDYIEWHNSNNDITDFVAEKIQVKIGDKAEYMLKSPINSGKALIVIEKDENILEYFIHDIKSYSDKIIIDVKDNYYPNYYLKAFLIGSENNNPLPIYKRALVVTKVNTDYKKLNIDIKTDKKDYLPGDFVQLNITVKDYLGNPVKNTDVSISLVDESLLALKGNPKKNPYAFFYDLKRYLGISSYSSLKNLIEKLEVKDNSNGEKGGAGDQIKGGDSKKKRGEFKDTAFWQASGITNNNGQLIIQTTKLPDNLTTWVIEVLANTKNDTKVGVNYETIITSKKLLINDNLPRFFGSNDIIVLSPVIFNKTGENKTFKIELDITNVEILGDKTQLIKIVDGGSKTVNFKVKVNDIGVSDNTGIFTSKINIKANSIYSKQIDEIEKFVRIVEVSTPEFVSTFGKTKESSFEEKISLGNIIKGSGKLTINYSVTLLNSILDGVEYLNKYPYGCSEQKTSAIMPNVFIKKLYSSVGTDFDLKTKMIKYWAGEYIGYTDKSLDQIIKEYLVNIRKYQKNDGGFVYFYDMSYGNNYSNFALSSYILESGANIRDIGYKLDEKTYFDIIKYLKNRFYINQIEGCKITKYNNCKYNETDRLKAISAILSFDSSDYEAYKMYKLISFKYTNNSINLEKAKVIAKLINLSQINKSEKKNLKNEAKTIIDKIISEELVFNPKGAYLGKSDYYSRFENTVSLFEVISIIGIEEFSDIDKIIDNLVRWIIGEKKNGNFGSTSDNISVIKAITKYLKSTSELKNIKNFTKIKLNNEIIEERKFTDDNKLDVYTKVIDLGSINDENSFVIDKSGNGTIYYDLNLSYYKEASQIKARDEGFFIETKYYKYDDYKIIELEKKAEWKEYLAKKIGYDELEYTKNIFEYLSEVNGGSVGDLLITKNKIITTETRDKVAFEGFIPAGAELVNPNLDTSSKKEVEGNNFHFDKLEYRTDRIFAYKQIMYPGIFEFTYLFRLTHSGEYSIKPSRISEFYNVEVFGRDKGKIFEIK